MTNPASQITIVTGLPRSGTSLLMQMLEAGGLSLLCDDHRKPDADNPRGYYEYEPVKRSLRDLAWVDVAGGRAVKVVAPLLTKLPPDRPYRVLLLHRDLGPLLASQRVMLERAGQADDGLPEPRLREILSAQWKDCESWCRSHASWLLVDHAQLLADPAAASAQIAEFLGGELDVAAMTRCVDPRLHRQRASPSEPA